MWPSRWRRMDKERIAEGVRLVLQGLGVGDEVLRDTPGRVATMLAEELCWGLGRDPAEALGKTLPNPGTGMVILKGIPFHSLCEHHLLPFIGRAGIAYFPGERIAGLDGLVRVLETAAAKPQLQERLGEEVADALERALRPKGVLVHLEAEHLCLSLRGPRKQALLETVAARGLFAQDKELLAQALSRIKGRYNGPVKNSRPR